ncbi:MAG: VOC family protein [Chloroflexi bacterium]|nr:VOC family protein [Chloroflexota bacterium]
MKVEGVDHIHIAVNDLEKASKFFCELFSTKPAQVKEDPEFGFKWQFLPLGNVVLELMQPTSPNSPISQFLKSKGGGVHALSIKVPDIEKGIAEMQARGLRLVSRANVGGIKEAHFHPKDTFGFMIELVEHKGKTGATIEAQDEM